MSRIKGVKILNCDHTSVGALIYGEDASILMIERKKFPYGIAPPAGHCDGDSFLDALKKEVKEEVGLDVVEAVLHWQGKKQNRCRRGGRWHRWQVFMVKAEGVLKRSIEETKSARWYSLDEVLNLAKKTREYLNGDISEVEWQANPGLEVVWFEMFGQFGRGGEQN